MNDSPHDQFAAARRIADDGDYDRAIDSFLAGLRLDPENVAAHKDLRTIGLKRKAAGGKSLGMIERWRLLRAKREPIERLISAERVLAYNPGDLDAMEAFLKATSVGGFEQTAEWIADLLDRSTRTRPLFCVPASRRVPPSGALRTRQTRENAGPDD
jgi:hypothetical protein